MAQTLTEKIFTRAAGAPVRAGELVVAALDFAMVQDINGPRVVNVLTELGVKQVFDPERVIFTFDHFSPEPTPLAAAHHARMRQAAGQYGITLHDVGAGICHQLVVECGGARPGWLVAGTDSHATMYGALAAFGVTLGATEMAVALQGGSMWFRVPPSVRVVLEGRRPDGVTGKDVALHLTRLFGEEGGAYRSLEFAGDGVPSVPVHDRLTLCNLAADFGFKAALFPADEITRDWFEGRGVPVPALDDWHGDAEARYLREERVDLSALEPLVALPGSLGQVCPLSEVAGRPVTMVFIGTCTNGRLEDFREACAVLKGRRVANGVRLLCYPASRSVQRALLDEGMLEILLEAGAVVMPPGCGPCAGLHGGVVDDTDVVFSTGSRNYPGRMGAAGACIYLGSAAAAAAPAAVEGVITDPRPLMQPAEAVRRAH